MKIIPFGDKMFVKVQPRAIEIKGVLVPDNHRMRTEKAEIISVGEDVKRFKPGDKILLTPYAGTHVQTPETYSEESTHRIIVEHEILAKFKD
jgi:co-chaperonin GroES (HSP10)